MLNKGISQLAAYAFVAVFALAIGGGILGLVGAFPGQATGQTSTPEAGSAGEAVALAGTCDDAGSPSILLGTTSANNNTEEFLAVAGRVYDISSSDLTSAELFAKGNTAMNADAILDAVQEHGVFVDSHTTAATGKNSEASVSCGGKYAIVYPRVDGTTTSAVGGWIQDQTTSPGFILEVAQNSDLSLSIVDENQGTNGAAVYESTETTAGGQSGSGSSFYNHTGNATDGAAGLVVAANGELDLILRFEDDTSAAADEQVRDPYGGLYFLVDLDNEEADAAEWDEDTVRATVSDGDGSLTFIENTVSEDPTLATLLSKQSFDLAYRIDGQDFTDGDKFKIDFYVKTLTDINADDDVRFAIASGGLSKSTKGTGIIEGLVDDSSSATPTYGLNVYTQVVS